MNVLGGRIRIGIVISPVALRSRGRNVPRSFIIGNGNVENRSLQR